MAGNAQSDGLSSRAGPKKYPLHPAADQESTTDHGHGKSKRECFGEVIGNRSFTANRFCD
jgi:hypothetical protein